MRFQIAMNWLASVTLVTSFVTSSASGLAQDEPKRDDMQLAAIEKYWSAMKNNNATVFNHASVSNMKCSMCHQGVRNITWATQQDSGASSIAWFADALQQNNNSNCQFIIQNLSTSANPLGVQVVSMSPEFAGHLGLDKAAVVLREVPESSPAYQGGLRAYDVVLQANDEKLDSPSKFDKVVTAQAGRTLALSLLHRGGKKELTLSVPGIVSTAATPKEELSKEAQAEMSVYKLGVVLASVDDVLRSHLNLPKGEGVLITDVTMDGPASKIGCEANDIFLSLDDKPITSQEQLKSLVQTIGDREVALKLLRRGKSIEVKIKPNFLKEAASTDYASQRADFLALHTSHDYLLNRDYDFQISLSQRDPKGLDSGNSIQRVKASLADIQAKMTDIMVTLESLEKEATAPHANKPKTP